MNTELLIQFKKLIIVVIIIQLAIFLAILIYKMLKRRRENILQKQLLQWVSQHYDGKIDLGTLTRFPKTSFSHQGYTLDIYCRPRTRYKKACTILEASIPSGKDFEFVIYPKSLLSDMAKVLGMQDVVIGQHVFDQKFIIKTNNELLIKEFLSQDVCRQILGLPIHDVSLKFQKGRFILAIDQMFKENGEYEQMINLGKILVDELGYRT